MKRRKFIQASALTAFSISAYGNIHWNGTSFEGDNVTTTDILGPFYRPGSPMRNDLIPAGSTGEILTLGGTIFQKDGKSPLSNTLIEVWQCDENERYDNTSDDYVFRGALKTGGDGTYQIKTIVPVPYKDGEDWRPAHIHMRISSADHQDLITQIYFKGNPYITEDPASASPQSINRILEIEKDASGQKRVKFDVVMGKSLSLNDAGYSKITGLYRLKNGMAEFQRQDDLLFLKLNGQYMEGLVYKGDNSFEGGMGYNKAKFEILSNGDVKTQITMWDSWSEDDEFLEKLEGIKILKYKE